MNKCNGADEVMESWTYSASAGLLFAKSVYYRQRTCAEQGIAEVSDIPAAPARLEKEDIPGFKNRGVSAV